MAPHHGGSEQVYGEIEFECNHWSVFENAIDMAHIHYLHNDTFGNQDQPEIRGMTCSANAYGVTAEFRLHNKAVKGWEFSKVRPGAESQHFLGFECLKAEQDGVSVRFVLVVSVRFRYLYGHTLLLCAKRATKTVKLLKVKTHVLMS